MTTIIDDNLGGYSNSGSEDNNSDHTHLNIKVYVDAKQFRCPMPLLKAKQALNQVEAGELIHVMATDSGSVRDFHSFIDLTEHEMISTEDNDGTYVYIIKKGVKK